MKAMGYEVVYALPMVHRFRNDDACTMAVPLVMEERKRVKRRDGRRRRIRGEGEGGGEVEEKVKEEENSKRR